MKYFETWDFPGDLNMAIDYVLGRFGYPFLRFYTWKVPTLSLGVNQKIENINFKFIKEIGYECVRRPTGGRAVFHFKELTYSVVIPKGHKFFNLSVLEFYKQISLILVEGLNNLGFPVELSERNLKGNTSACFDSPSWYEITLKGYKVVGSAQMRTKEFVLQHGSIILETNNEIKYCFKNIEPEVAQYGLDLHMKINIFKLKDTLLDAFSKYFEIEKLENFDEIIQLAEQEKERFVCKGNYM
ncbi:lipoate--protein ligase family protein [Thermosipho atlanticus]|uniref:Lipoate-protein ligase A n=1 Tax=Thermosipho atlanticus DSM 15807 TaxID=1123380 RepID=A0A1M5RTT9_9BACT|nr:ligase [Thermosipho atlanticus]SHH29600.1 lipoate-protein ligase A [Thermosipho atlanticus DSM 15807]